MALVVSEQLGKIRKGKGKTKSEKKVPYWKRRIENNIKKWRQDLSKMTEVHYCRTKLGEEEKKGMDRSYGLCQRDHPCHTFSETKNYYCWSKDPPMQPKEPTVPPEQNIQK